MKNSSAKGRSRGGAWLIIFGAMLWGTTGTSQAFAPQGAQPLVIGTMRMLIGGAALLVFAIVKGSIRNIKSFKFWPTLVSAICMGAYQLFFFEGVYRTGVVAGTIVGIGSAPIFGGLLGTLVNQEKLERRWFIATGFAITGAAILVSASGEINLDPLGILLAVGAGFVYAVFIAASKSILETHSPDAAMAVIFSIGSIFMLPLMIGQDVTWVGDWEGLIVLLHLGIITVGVGYSLFAMGLQSIPVSAAATLTLAEPLTAGTLGLLILKEKLSGIAFLGIGLLLIGLAILSFSAASLASASLASATACVLSMAAWTASDLSWSAIFSLRWDMA